MPTDDNLTKRMTLKKIGVMYDVPQAIYFFAQAVGKDTQGNILLTILVPEDVELPSGVVADALNNLGNISFAECGHATASRNEQPVILIIRE